MTKTNFENYLFQQKCQTESQRIYATRKYIGEIGYSMLVLWQYLTKTDKIFRKKEKKS